MNADNLLKGVECQNFCDKKIKVSDIAYDSRKVKQNSCFVALKGNDFDGHNYISDAIEKGASIIISENEIGDYSSLSYTPIIKVNDTRKDLIEEIRLKQLVLKITSPEDAESAEEPSIPENN